jgi:zinc-ribbon domain
MATIKCPKCKEKLQAGAQVCRYCKHNFDDAEVSASRAAARSSTYSKMAMAVVLLILVAWCKSQPEATPQEKQEVANLLGLPAAAADPANVKTD